LFDCLFACLFLPFWSAPTDRQTDRQRRKLDLRSYYFFAFFLQVLLATSFFLSFVYYLFCCYQ
jgi:hypothetical protein